MKRKNFKFIKTNFVLFSSGGEIKKDRIFIPNLSKKYYFYIKLKKGS